ncbi:MAG: hypothetical protein JW779_02265 [Candidatus Thorarchaeota archaeon]|nr:hypothetical protein [Candidatus Thorarchaeota archaeon]
MEKTRKRALIGISLILIVTTGIMIPLALISQPIQVEEQGLLLIDIRNPRNPILITMEGEGKIGRDVTVVDNPVFLVDDVGGLTIIQVTKV